MKERFIKEKLHFLHSPQTFTTKEKTFPLQGIIMLPTSLLYHTLSFFKA